MNTFADRSNEQQSRANAVVQEREGGDSESQLVEQRPGATAQRALDESLNQSPKVQSQLQLQQMFDQSSRVTAQRKLADTLSAGKSAQQPQQALQRQETMEEEDEEPLQGKLVPLQKEATLEDEEPLQPKSEPVQQQENKTGLPDNLKAGVENLSGLAMDDVRVHFNSPAPATVQALAYTQGTDIHVGPGQEQHLAHEAWHVAQQKQGRVQPTTQAKGVAINDERSLEAEADVMGSRAMQASGDSLQRMTASGSEAANHQSGTPTIQRLTIAYTAVDIMGGVDPNAFADQVVQYIVHARDAIPNQVKNDVDGFGDCPAAGTYKHHVPYAIMLARIKTLCEGETREDIVDWMTNSVVAVGVDPATFGIPNPLLGVAAFNTWLDSAIVAVCDWADNIFRGASTGDGGGTIIDNPTAPSAALTNRLTNAVNTLTGLGFWP